MHFALIALAFNALSTASPLATQATRNDPNGLGGLLDTIQSYLPIVGGNEGPIIPGIAGDKVRRADSEETSELQSLADDLQGYLDGTNQLDLGSLLAEIQSYLPIVGGNAGPIIPGLAGDR